MFRQREGRMKIYKVSVISECLPWNLSMILITLTASHLSLSSNILSGKSHMKHDLKHKAMERREEMFRVSHLERKFGHLNMSQQQKRSRKVRKTNDFQRLWHTFSLKGIKKRSETTICVPFASSFLHVYREIVCLVKRFPFRSVAYFCPSLWY